MKTFHTNITSAHFIFYKTHQFLTRNLFSSCRNYVPRSEYKDLSSKYFFLISNKLAHSIKIRLTVITKLHATQTGASFFLKMKECVNKSDQYVIYIEQCLLCLYYKRDNSLFGSFGRISRNLLDTKTVSSHSFCQI